MIFDLFSTSKDRRSWIVYITFLLIFRYANYFVPPGANASQIYSATTSNAKGFTAEGRALTMDEAADQVLAAIRKFEQQKRR